MAGAAGAGFTGRARERGAPVAGAAVTAARFSEPREAPMAWRGAGSRPRSWVPAPGAPQARPAVWAPERRPPLSAAAESGRGRRRPVSEAAAPQPPVLARPGPAPERPGWCWYRCHHRRRRLFVNLETLIGLFRAAGISGARCGPGRSAPSAPESRSGPAPRPGYKPARPRPANIARTRSARTMSSGRREPSTSSSSSEPS